MRKEIFLALAIAAPMPSHAHADTLIKLVCATSGGDTYRFAFNMSRGEVRMEGDRSTMKLTRGMNNLVFKNADDSWSLDRSTLQIVDRREGGGAVSVIYVAQCQKDLPQM